MIISAQPFFNEVDLLEIKMRELGASVDLHVIVESTRTFTGIPKPLHFAQHAHLFRDFRVHHVIVTLPEQTPSPWDREWLTHRAILDEVRKLKPEIAIWSDTDECPRGDTMGRFRAMKAKTAHIDMDNLLFFFDRLDVTQRPTTAKIGYFDPAADHQPWRGETHHPVIPESGWHFSYFGGRERLAAKLKATSHAAEDGAGSMIHGVERGELPGLHRTANYPAGKLPAFVRENRKRFAASFLNE